MTLGFNDVGNLDEGNMWPIAFALKELARSILIPNHKYFRFHQSEEYNYDCTEHD